MLVEAGGDGSKMLDAVEEPLDAVAIFVDARAEGWRIDAMIERPNVRQRAGARDLRPERIAVVAVIGEQNAVAAKQFEHGLAGLAVVRLPLGQLEEDRQAVRVDDRVDLGRKPAAGTSHATTTAAFFSPLAAC